MPVASADSLCAGDVRAACVKPVMDVLDLLGVTRWPEPRRGECRGGRNEPQNHECCRQAGVSPEPPGGEIGDQPAGVRQRELRREKRRTVFRRRGSA